MAHLGSREACVVHFFFVNGFCVLAFHACVQNVLSPFISSKLNVFIMATFVVCSPQCPTMGTSCSFYMIFMRNFPYWHINLGLPPLNGNPSFKVMPFTFLHFHNFLKYLCAKGSYT
jgi:hypothetical protein